MVLGKISGWVEETWEYRYEKQIDLEIKNGMILSLKIEEQIE